MPPPAFMPIVPPIGIGRAGYDNPVAIIGTIIRSRIRGRIYNMRGAKYPGSGDSKINPGPHIYLGVALICGQDTCYQQKCKDQAFHNSAFFVKDCFRFPANHVPAFTNKTTNV